MSRKYLILIVDDDSSSLDAMSSILERDGYQTVLALEGYIAVQLATEEPVDLAIIDLYLPDLSGIQLLKVIKRARPDIPAIIVTATPSEPDLLAAWDAGAYSFLTKPIDINVFRRTVARALQPKTSTSPGSPTVEIREQSMVFKWSRWIIRK